MGSGGNPDPGEPRLVRHGPLAFHGSPDRAGDSELRILSTPLPGVKVFTESQSRDGAGLTKRALRAAIPPAFAIIRPLCLHRVRSEPYLMKAHRTLQRLCAIALLTTSPWLAAGPAGYYRWLDDDNKPQFTQQPPKDRPSEFVRVSTGTSSKVGPGAEEMPREEGAADQSGSTAARPTLESVPDRDPAKCQQSRETLAVLNSKARIREKGADGEYRYLTPDEIAEQRKLAADAVGIYCESDE